jgi:hypothetical protein
VQFSPQIALLSGVGEQPPKSGNPDRRRRSAAAQFVRATARRTIPINRAAVTKAEHPSQKCNKKVI